MSAVPVGGAFGFAQAGGPLPWRSVDELVRHAADEYGAKEFLRDDHGGSLSFEEFEQLSSQAAAHLLALGLDEGDRIAIFLGNCLRWPVVWAAVLRIGAIAVPVNSGYQESDLGFVLRDSSARAVVTEKSLSEVVDKAARTCLELRHTVLLDDHRLWDTPVHEVHSGAVEDSVANFQYTSGTTGFPKGCVLAHGYWMRTGLLAAAQFRLRQTDVVLTAQKYSYLDPMWLTAMCLSTGATLVVLDRFSASGFWPAVRRHRVSCFYVLGTMPTLLYKQPEDDADREHSVRLVLCSAIPAQLHNRIEERWGVPWREVYGLTETGVDLCVPIEAHETVGTGTIGRPVPTKQIRIVDSDGGEVGTGEPGELLVKGEPMMRGYHDRPEATDKTIVDGWLHTGDIVVSDEEDWVYIVGRIKDMIRRGGENIAAAEVENVVGLHPAVLSSAVTPVPDEVFGEEVKAYVQLRPGYEASKELAEGVLTHAGEHLARFKVPRFLEFVDDFPLTPSERISKAELLSARPDQRVNAYDSRKGGFLDETPSAGGRA